MTVKENILFDAVIVGAGPAGSTCAALLARQGARVLICDKATFPREKICGDCINPACWDLFTLLGVQKEIATNAEPISDITIVGRAGKVLNIPVVREGNPPKSRPFISIKRDILDSVLLQRAVADGALFQERTSIESIQCDHHGWKISLRNQESGAAYQVTGKILIGADGRNTRVARLLAELDGGNNETAEHLTDRIGVQFIARRRRVTASGLVMYFFEEGYGGIIGVNTDEENVAMVVDRNLASLASKNPDAFIVRTIHANPQARELVPELSVVGKIHTAFPITPRKYTHRQKGAYLIGDARRTTEPFTGEGILFAMQDGVLTAGRISKRLGLSREKFRVSSRNRAWRDKILVPGLQNREATERIISLGQRYKKISQIVADLILR